MNRGHLIAILSIFSFISYLSTEILKAIGGML